MPSGTLFMLLSIPFVLLSIVLLIWIVRTIYVAFVQKKDEREKLIITKSMAHAFVVLFALNLIQMLGKLIDYERWISFFSKLKEGIYVDPAMLCIIILGITIFVNRKKHGG